MRRAHLTFQVRSTTQDGLGHRGSSWTDSFTAMCRIKQKSAREFQPDSGEHAQVTEIIETWHQSAFDTFSPAGRIVDRSFSPERVYDIRSIVQPTRRKVRLEVVRSY